MPIYASEPEGKGNFTPAPTGLQRAVCCDVVDLGIVKTNFQGEEKSAHKVRLVFQSEKKHPETGKPLIVSKSYRLSLHEKATLRKDIDSWQGPIPAGERKNYDLEAKLIGKSALINVVHNVTEETTYANIANIAPLYEGMAPLTISADYVRKKDRPEQDGKPAAAQAPVTATAPAPSAFAGSGNVEADITTVARVLALRTGRHFEDEIYEASKFTGNDGKEVGFRNPTGKSPKWQEGTLRRLNKAVESLSLIAEVADPSNISDADIPF